MSTATLEAPIQNETLNQQIEHKQFGQLWPQYKIDNGSGRKIGVVFGNEVVELLVDHPCWATPLADLETWYSRLRLKSKFVAPTFPAPTPAYSHPVRWDMPLAYTRYDVAGLTPVSPRTAKALAIEAGVRLFYLENEHKHWLAARPAIEQSRLESITRQLAYNTGTQLHLPCPVEVLDVAMRKTVTDFLGDLAKGTPAPRTTESEDHGQELNPASDFNMQPDKEGREERPTEQYREAKDKHFRKYESEAFKECVGRSWLALLESAKFHTFAGAKEAEKFATGIAARQCQLYKRELLGPLVPYKGIDGEITYNVGQPAGIAGHDSATEALDGGFDDEDFPNIQVGGRFERARSGRGPYGQIQPPSDPITEGSCTPRDKESEQPFWDVLTAFEDFHPAEYQWLVDYYTADSNNSADRARAGRLRTKIAATVDTGTL